MFTQNDIYKLNSPERIAKFVSDNPSFPIFNFSFNAKLYSNMHLFTSFEWQVKVWNACNFKALKSNHFTI